VSEYKDLTRLLKAMKTTSIVSSALLAALLTVGVSSAQAQARGGEEDTRLGKIEFKGDYVTEETAAKLRNELKFQAAVQT
jgi:hypothetical protein